LNETFNSNLAQYIESFLQQKRAFGFKYESNIRYLINFDAMCMVSFPKETTLTREMAMSWGKAYSDEGKEGFSRRMSSIRELARYMTRNDIPAFVIPRNCGKCPNRRYVPHIFTENELTLIFEAVDALYADHNYPTNHLVAPVLLRLLYAGGLRPYEGRLLKRKDIDLEKGTIFIPESKRYRDRIIVMDSSMLELCRKYDIAVRRVMPNSDYFFPSNGKNSEAYGRHWVRDILSRCLNNAGLTEIAGNPPRPYDFRHTFATHTLYRWLEEGRDLENCVPYLSAYMGHERFEHTYYYIHLVPELFSQLPPEISARFSVLIPEVER